MKTIKVEVYNSTMDTKYIGEGTDAKIINPKSRHTITMTKAEYDKLKLVVGLVLRIK